MPNLAIHEMRSAMSSFMFLAVGVLLGALAGRTWVSAVLGGAAFFVSMRCARKVVELRERDAIDALQAQAMTEHAFRVDRSGPVH